MAAVLDAMVSFVIDTVKKMAADEVHMLLGVPDDVNKLEERLQDLKAVLADAERRRVTEKAVQRWVLMLKDVMYEATDILDICIIHAVERQGSIRGEDFRCFDPIGFTQNIFLTHNIGNRIKDLNKKLDSICESGAKFDFIRTEQNLDRGVVTYPAGSKTSPVIERSSLVGKKIEKDTVRLVNMLAKHADADADADADDCIVVAISGTGGIGKTALAQNIYNHQTIKDKFSIRMWLSITQACTETELLKEAIYHAEGRDCHDHGKSLLESTLVDTIRDKKIFVVLDDMWTAAKWNNVLKASFSYVARGSRVLVTTRDDRVARAMKAQYLHHVDYLGLEDAWSLLKKEVIATERDRLKIETLKDTGLKILGRCGGLPLAIKVIGGLLRQRSMNIVEWDRVLKNPAWSLDGMPEELNHAIYLSYDDLPPHLKQCLLYYSLIPQKASIDPDQLIEMWISEGLVSSIHSDDLEQIGRDYNKELIMRNLVQPWFIAGDGEAAAAGEGERRRASGEGAVGMGAPLRHPLRGRPGRRPASSYGSCAAWSDGSLTRHRPASPSPICSPVNSHGGGGGGEEEDREPHGGDDASSFVTPRMDSKDTFAFEEEVVKLMETSITSAMQYLQNKGSTMQRSNRLLWVLRRLVTTALQLQLRRVTNSCKRLRGPRRKTAW